LHYADGKTEKFQSANWLEKLNNDTFRERVFQLMEEEVILRFEKKEVDAKEFYDIDGEES